MDLPINSSAPRRARQALAEATAESGQQIDIDALLVISELVTNAVRFARTRVHLSISTSEERLHLEVSDDGLGRPEPGGPSEGAVTGRGLRIVAALTTGWGVRAWPGGKTVWCNLVSPRPRTSPARPRQG